MGDTKGASSLPDYVSPPGETLREVLKAVGMPQGDLATRMGMAEKTISEIVNGKAPITPDTAVGLERVLGVPARFWMKREQDYREHLARARDATELAGQVRWLQKVPVSALVRLGWIQGRRDKVQQLEEVLAFFGVSSLAAWKGCWLGTRPAVRLRSSAVFQKDPLAVAAWLRRGEVQAQDVECGRYDAGSFAAALRQARALSLKQPPQFLPTLVRTCAASGVAIVLTRPLPKIRISGAARWLSPVHALLQLSLRHRTDDHFWFSFFHEAAHVVLHGKKRTFVDETERGDGERAEDEANCFAENHLLPRAQYNAFVAGRQFFSEADVRGLADRLCVAPGIVVGRLQHDGRVPFRNLNGLKAKLCLPA